MTSLAVIGDVHANFKRLARVIDRIGVVGVDGVLMVGDLACAGLGARSAKRLSRAWRVIGSTKSLTSADADADSELDSVDIAAENSAPSTTPTTPVGSWLTIKSANTRSDLANGVCGGNCE